jgi:protein-S-isoprenylcysteine O-methyltransferase Ste14
VDLFSGGYLGLRFLGALYSLVSSRQAFKSKSLRREWWGQTSNPGIVKWAIILMLGDLLVFVDYGHWRILSSLERPEFQGLGLVIYLFTTVWQIWTDSHLARHFNDEQSGQGPTVIGPFRYIRHPRYSAAILGRVALALVFASLLGWLSLLPWTIVLLQKVRAEEAHLRRSFGAQYDAYVRRTARLLPRVY